MVSDFPDETNNIVMSRHWFKNEVFKKIYQKLLQKKKNRDLMNRVAEDRWECMLVPVMYSINTIIRFTIVIVYMYNVSPRLTLYTILPLPLLSYSIFKLSSEINKRSTVFQQYLSVSSFSQEIFSGIQ
jgi:ATP-binding cassette subfamily B protein